MTQGDRQRQIAIIHMSDPEDLKSNKIHKIDVQEALCLNCEVAGLWVRCLICSALDFIIKILIWISTDIIISLEPKKKTTWFV